MHVSRYIETENSRPFVWGETDCATRADRWFKLMCGYSPMQRFGRLVMNEGLGRAWLAQHGGVVRAMRDVMKCTESAVLNGTPSAGDIGIVVVNDRAAISIFDGNLWSSRDVDGPIFANDEHRYIAWEVACHRH
ncbi:DUF6950 family protein [Rhizobium leguminosarum]|uniref:DUF6950 family protein n=1 Tax=Rhizobium leguminosarum TaxID=384 RepID=UPI00396576FB